MPEIAPCFATDPGDQYDRERRIEAAQARLIEYSCRVCGRMFGQSKPIHGDENKVCFPCRVAATSAPDPERIDAENAGFDYSDSESGF